MDEPNFELNWLSSIILFGILQGLLILWVFSKKTRYTQHKYLVFFISFLLIGQIHSFLMKSGLMFSSLHLMNINAPLVFLFGPLIFYYLKSNQEQKPLHWKYMLHFFPFFFYLGYSFNFYLQPMDFKYNALIRTLALDLPFRDVLQKFPSDPWSIQGWVVVELLSLHLLIYGLLCVFKLTRSKNIMAIKNKSLYQWHSFLSILLITAALVLFFSEGGVINGKVFLNSPFPNYSADVFSTVAIYACSIYLVRSPKFLDWSSKNKYAKSSLTPAFRKAKLQAILDIVEKEKLYLDPEFSLALLSNRANLSNHHVSQILNEELQLTFFELTNSYRIREAQRLLKESEYVKMEALAHQLGYRSKSSFYNAFKKLTDQTPSNYLKSTNV